MIGKELAAIPTKKPTEESLAHFKMAERQIPTEQNLSFVKFAAKGPIRVTAPCFGDRPLTMPSSETSRIDVICDNIPNNPQCFHGPTLQFRRRGHPESDYFACSACRDRRDCSFYLKVTEGKSNQSLREIRKRQQVVKKSTAGTKLRKLLKTLPKKRRGFCYSCCELFDVSVGNHAKCVTTLGLTKRQINRPTTIGPPRDNDKLEAQYFFTDDTTLFLVDTLVRLKVDRVLCVGTPRIHEMLNCLKMRSLLLDIDRKYHYFYTKRKFIWYNMFNNFTFNPKHTKLLQQFLRETGKMIVLMDPPFGGRIEPLTETLKSIQTEYNSTNPTEDLQVIWFFPYFMERHIKESLPTFRMLDYQVNYQNHDSYNDTGPRRRKAGSPVRIFTNLELKLFDLSENPSYKFCESCGYWVTVNNQHCKKCNSCTSKNGMSYVHCTVCKKCVKPTYCHCKTCKRCCLPSHICLEFQPDTSCYNCHEPGHKRVNCPNKL